MAGQAEVPEEMRDEVARMDDFEVVKERQNVMTALAYLIERYKRLTNEMQRRENLRWMIAP